MVTLSLGVVVGGDMMLSRRLEGFWGCSFGEW